MRRPNPTVWLTGALAALLLCTSNARAEWPHDYRAPVQVVQALANQFPTAALPDGSGGGFVFFADQRSGTFDVYAMHLRGNGTPDPAWPSTGAPLCTAAADQSDIHAVSDGAGGAFVSWIDLRSGTPKNYATRMLPSGAIAPGFATDGVLLDPIRANAQHTASIVADGLGGMVAVWEYDFAPLDHDIVGARIAPNGVLTWTLALYSGGAMDQKPAVDLEVGACGLAWCEGTNQISMSRFFPTGGGLFGGVVQATSQADVSVGPRICPDGWSGNHVAFVEKVGVNWQVSVRRFFGGQPSTLFSNLVGALPAAPVLGDLVYAGNFTAWLASGLPGFSTTWFNSLTRDIASGAMPAGILTDPARGLPLVPDGGGGIVHMRGTQFPVGEEFLTATRRTLAGFTPALWYSYGGSEGVFAMQLLRAALPGALCSDGDGGAIVFGYDQFFFPARIWATRMDRWGALDGAPQDVRVRDVQGDQGGHVRVSWRASYLDFTDNRIVDSYRLWRQVPVAAAQSLIAQGRPEYAVHDGAGTSTSLAAGAPPPAALTEGTIWLRESLGATFAWEYVTSQIANSFAAYSLTVPTVSDSSASGPANTVYMVEALWTTSPTGVPVGWPSLPDSGHSVDNLPPATPSPFTAAIVGGTSTELAWGANSEPDLADYELYRGSTLGFVPGPSNLIATLTGTSRLDGAVGQYYKLAAVDSHGNRSGFAVVTPGGTLDAPGDQAPRELALSLASANPAVHGVTLRYALPSAGRVSLALFDVNGRLVHTLVEGDRDAGEYSLRWDGRLASGGTAASGMYFARLAVRGHERVVRLVLSR